MLILDLDDTIFRTNSIDPKIVNEPISLVKGYYEQIHRPELLEKVTADLWSNPHDIVFQRYKTPESVVRAFYESLEGIDHSALDIHTFEDYEVIRSLDYDKVLVTTGLRGLQQGKIRALGIAEDFKQIHIDDPRDQPRKQKIDIFRQLVEETQKKPEEFWVIGDNPSSEIAAGQMLGMKTVQRRSESHSIALNVDYVISSFEELKDILE